MKKNIVIAILITAIVLTGGCLLLVKGNFGGGGGAARDCKTTVSSAVSIGASNSVTILAARSGRSYARIQIALDTLGVPTSTPFVSFSSAATLYNGMALSTTTPYLEFGLTTDNPYTGIVTGITNTGSTTVLVVECR